TPQGGHLPDRFERDTRVHLGLSYAAIAKCDRHLQDLEACLHRTVRQLDLEAITVGMDVFEVEMLQHGAAEALEPSGEVADRDPEHAARVPGAAAAHEPARETPVGDAAALDVAR